MDQRKQIARGLIEDFLTAIRQPDKTPIVPAPNRWFAKPEDFPHQQPMIERALAATGKSRDDFLHGAYLDPRTGQDLTGRMMSDVGAVIDPNTGRPVMSGRESGLESFAELEKRLGNQTLSNLVRRSKFKPLGGDPLLNDIPFITTVESGPHFYGLGMEYASPTQLFQVQTGDNPHLRPKSRGDVFGMGEVIGRMQIGKGPEHDVYEKLFVAPRGSDVPGKKLSKAKGGEVHAAGGGLKQAVRSKIDDFLAELNRPAVPVSQQVIKGAQDILPTAEREANLAKFLEESKIKNRMYHGTRQAGTRSVSKPGEEGIREFKNSTRRMTFASPNTDFANSYAGRLDPEGMHRPTMYPVYIQAKNPWDYENPEHIESILPHLPYDTENKWSLVHKKTPDDIRKALKTGDWAWIEDADILRAIEKAGYDAAHMQEVGVKNLGVFDPKNIKSAIGNRGTYDINDPDITKASGGEVHAASGGLKQTVRGKIDEFLAGLKVKPPSDNIAVVKSANFDYPKVIGNQTLKVNDVSGGVRMSDPYERKRVEALAQKMSSPNGYISRIIVDHKNNVVEGQHRLEALRHLGIEDVPVYKIEDLSDTMPVASMESALNAVAPIHPDHVNQLIGHALEDIAEHGIDHARTLDYGKYQKFYDAALDAAFPDLKKAAGGEVNMDKGGDPMLADLIKRYNTSRNKSRYSAGIFDSNAPGEVTSITPTVKERMASGLQSAMEAAGSDQSKARQRAQTIIGGPNSRLPGGFGVADIGAMVNPTIAAAMIPVYAESAMHDLAGVPDALKRGDYVGAGVDTAFGLMDLIPAIGQGKQVAKDVAKGIKNAVTSDAGYDLAQRVLNATGTAPAQIMMGPMSKTWRKADADLAVKMEGEGRSANDIWRKTGTFRAPDGRLRQEIPDIDMRYTGNAVERKQYENAKKRYEQAKAKATTPEELNDANDYWNKTKTNAIFNLTGKAQNFVDHPELFAAYPELAKYAFKQLEPTHSQFTAPETTQGFYSPKSQRITINTDAPYKRSTALHELQHAIQELEGWQGGSNPEYIAAKMAERDLAKASQKRIQDKIDELKAADPIGNADLIRDYGISGDWSRYILNQTEPLEGITDPYKAYKKMSGEEEARMVQARRDYDERSRRDSLPIWNYETPPSEQITKDFATGGAVMMAGGKDVTKEAIKQGVKKGISAIDEFLSSLKPGETPATAADRAAAGRAGAALIKATPQVKASEALGQAMEQGFNKTTTTQSDRTRVGGGNIGGAPFSAISEADPRYEGKVWGVMDQGTASRLANLTSPNTAWSTMLGSATQLKTNPVVFAKLEKQFKKGLKEGRLQPELEDKINRNLGLFLGEGANIRDPEIWKMLDTFEKRASMADLMMGNGLPPKKGGVALGGEKSGKGVIFNPTEILIDETERGLLHPEHGGYVPTFAVGPRLFSLTGESSFRPDLHPGFPTLLEGKDLGVNMMATPTEVYLPDWHARFKANNPDRQGPGYYDLALGVKGEGLPSQDLTDNYIRHLIREGYAEGGEVDSDGVTLDDFLSKQGY